MRKILLTVSILGCVLLNSYASEKTPVPDDESNSSVLLNRQNQSSDFQNLDLLTFEKAKKRKTSKNKTFFGKVKEKISTFTVNKKNIFSGKNFYIIPFLLGFLLGPIGILIVFLVNLKKTERKAKVWMAWVGWIWWLVILSIILIV